MRKNKKILIIGAGLAGLGASVHLKKAGYDPVILEASDRPGGLFTNYSIDDCDFDYGPKLLILDDSENGRELLSYLGENVQKLPIEESVYLKDFGILRFPLQRNLIELPAGERRKIIASLKKAKKERREILNFKDWLISHYGEYFANMILVPYEEKKWRLKLEEMDYRWALSRPVKVSLDEVIKGSKTRLPPRGHYYYPKHGNISTFTTAVVNAAGKILCNHPVTHVSVEKKYVIAGGKKFHYDILISTAPIDSIVSMTADLPEKYKAFSSNMLKRLSIVVFNMIFEGNHDLKGTAIYFPEKEFIFRRISVLQNLCPALARPGKTPITVEVSIDKNSEDYEDMYERVVDDLMKIDQFAKMGRPVKHQSIGVDFAYPLQTRGYSYHIADLHRYYIQYDVHHCGRGGTYNYSNGDVAYKQGAETAKHIIKSLSAEAPTFTVGLPTYKGNKYVVETVRSIRNSHGVPAGFPIIISVDGPALNPDIEKELKPYDVTLLYNKKRRGQAARNTQIIRAAKTDLVILTWEEALFAPDTLRTLVDAFAQDSSLTMATPCVTPFPARTMFQDIMQRGSRIVQKMAVSWNGGDNYLAAIGRCLAYRTSMAQTFQVPDGVMNCDAYYFFENKRLSGTFKYLPEAEVNYRSTASVKTYLRQVRKFVVSQKELSSYMRMDMKRGYRIPPGVFFRAVASELFISPTLTGMYLAVSVFARISSRSFYDRLAHLRRMERTGTELF